MPLADEQVPVAAAGFTGRIVISGAFDQHFAVRMLKR
jgi:hypothetical protein